MILSFVLTASLALSSTSPAVPEVRQVGRIQAKEIEESSGLVASRRHPGILYTHNDSGGSPMLYAIRGDGSLVKQYRVSAPHRDWEDIATDEAGRLYIADTGDNNVRRDWVHVHRLAEPDMSDRVLARRSKAKSNDTRRQENRMRVERTWTLRFPAAPCNCESLFILRDHAYLVTKVPPGQRAAIYRFPLDGTQDQLTLEKVTELSLTRPATGAAVSPDGARLAIVTDGVLWVYEIAGDVVSAGSLTPMQVPLPPRKIEAVTFLADGSILMTAESREVFAVALPRR